MTYQIKRNSGTNYWVTKNGYKVFDLKYPSSWSNEAYADVEDGSYYMEKESFWSSRFKISKNDRKLGNMSYDWRGHIVLDLIDETGRMFEIRMKYRGLFKPRFEVWLDKHTHLFTVRGSYNGWGTYLEYDLEKHRGLPVDFSEEELVGLMAHSARYYMMMSGMAGS